eukprot:m.2562 g.2562  ORF g.2562 m.2562 type:complete len:397 (+) comp8762_c0_seq1:72-1262(+)
MKLNFVFAFLLLSVVAQGRGTPTPAIQSETSESENNESEIAESVDLTGEGGEESEPESGTQEPGSEVQAPAQPAENGVESESEHEEPPVDEDHLDVDDEEETLPEESSEQEPVGEPEENSKEESAAMSLATAECNSQFEGYVRYNAQLAIIEYCTAGSWEFAMKPPLGSKDNPARSCNELFDSGIKENGVYFIKPTEDSPSYKAYCEDGWTLVMKIDGKKDTFGYYSDYWTQTIGYQTDSVEIDDTETQLSSYWTLPFDEVRIATRTEEGNNPSVTFPYTASSLYDVISSGKYRATYLGRDAWKQLVPDSSLQHSCNQEGFNVDPRADSPVNHRVRIGIVSNNENDCWTPDSHIGVGGDGSSCVPNDAVVVSGNGAGCWSDNFDKAIFTFNVIMVK